jgi:hypothetical protein
MTQQKIEAPIPHRLGLRAGDWVEVRSKEEILSTLDKTGRLEQMPFMPEMLQYCGRKFQVGKRAHKTCDPVNGLQSRRLPDAVHLEDLRCDGAAHAGCQAGCLLFWKEAWLKPVPSSGSAVSSSAGAPQNPEPCTEDELLRGTIAAEPPVGTEGPTYVCQATQVAAATTPLPWWNAKQYLEDYRSGNATVLQMLSAFVFWTYHNLSSLGLGFGSAMRWAYDVFQKTIGGTPYPWRIGRVPKGTRTPTAKLDVQEGETVRVKDYREILETLDEEWKNRGLYFDAEMVPYTQGTYKVLKRVKRIIDEKTGRMINLKNESLILDGVVCQARYAKCRKLCPRAYYHYWREIWVEKVSGAKDSTKAGSGPASE